MSIEHIIEIEDVKKSLDNEILLASACKAGYPRKKRLVYIPSIAKYSVCLLDDGDEIRWSYDALEDAIEHYNEIY